MNRVLFILKLLLSILTGTLVCFSANCTIVKFADSYNEDAHHVTLKKINFCKDCVDPNIQGSQIEGVVVNRSPDQWDWNDIFARLVYAFPNQGCRHGGLKNPREIVEGSVILIDRGEMTVAEQVRIAQHKGAIAAIIVDEQREKTCFDYPTLPCRDSFISLTRRHHDRGGRKLHTDIPTLLVTHEEGARLKEQFNLIQKHMAGYGWQSFEPHNSSKHDEWVSRRREMMSEL